MRYKNWLKNILVLSLIGILLLFGINWHIKNIGKTQTITYSNGYSAQTAIVLGAYVSPEGILCDMLKDRVETAVEL